MVSGNERQAKDSERGRRAVVAAHSTGEGGEARPTGPTGGKEKPGITFCWKERREGLRAYKPCYHNSSRVRWVAQLCAKRGVTCLVRQGRKPLATEEPDEGNLHVRICGEGAG